MWHSDVNSNSPPEFLKVMFWNKMFRALKTYTSCLLGRHKFMALHCLKLLFPTRKKKNRAVCSPLLQYGTTILLMKHSQKLSYFPDQAGLESCFGDGVSPVPLVYLSWICKLRMLTGHCDSLSRQSGITEGVMGGLGLTGALRSVVLLNLIVLHLPFHFTHRYCSVVQSLKGF